MTLLIPPLAWTEGACASRHQAGEHPAGTKRRTSRHHRRQENKPDSIRRRITDLLDAEKDLNWDEARLGVTPTLSNPVQRRSPTVLNLDIERLKNEFNVLTSEVAEKAKTLKVGSPELVALEDRIAKIQVTILQRELDRLQSLVRLSTPADPKAVNKKLWSMLGFKLASLTKSLVGWT